jgi:hypothetical protein
MNAESTYVRPARPRPTLVPPSGDGTHLAALVLALPMRVAATPLGRRLIAAATIAIVLVSLVGALYDHADHPRAAGVLAGAQALFGVGMTTFSVTQISLRQALTPPRLLGRVNATRRLLVFGIQPIGALVGGALGEWAGLYTALVAAAALQLASLLVTVASPLRSAREAPTAGAAVEGGS